MTFRGYKVQLLGIALILFTIAMVVLYGSPASAFLAVLEQVFPWLGLVLVIGSFFVHDQDL